jgi:hypothetical protein
MNDIDFKVNRDKSGFLNGFTLKGVGETESEAFCMSFPTAQQLGKGQIVFIDNKIVFEHGGVISEEANPALDVFGLHEGGKFSHDISAEDAEALGALLSRSGDYANAQIRVRHEIAWGKGFTVYVNR